jgi:diguanylate cyclase (GGDEF)-like protein
MNCKQFLPHTEQDHFCIPLVVGGSPVGVVQFLTPKSQPGNHNSAKFGDDVLAAEQYIREALPVIETKRLMAKLRDSALTDAMTGLRNRRFLEEYMDKLVAGIMRRKTILGLIMCDLDYFKQVNDQYGHDAGDIVLKETSKIIRESLRESDMAIRFGGEEFLVLLMDIEAGSASMVAEKIRKNIENASFKISDGVIKKTISLGTSEFPSDSTSLWQSIKYADVALYKSKEGGRNRTVSFTEDMWAGQQY